MKVLSMIFELIGYLIVKKYHSNRLKKMSFTDQGTGNILLGKDVNICHITKTRVYVFEYGNTFVMALNKKKLRPVGQRDTELLESGRIAHEYAELLHRDLG